MSGTPDDLEFRIARLRLEPNDVLVVKFDRPATMDAVARLRDVMKQATHSRILFIDPHVELSVLTRAEIEQRAR